MTLPASGTITSTQIRNEMNGFVGDLIIPSPDIYWLIEKTTPPIVWPNDFWGKSWGPEFVQGERFAALSSPGSQFTLPSGAPWATGDLVVVSQLVENASAAASVVPPGFIQLGSAEQANTEDGTVVKMIVSYRVLTAGQVGATFTGMVGDMRNRVAGIQFHFNKPVSDIEVIDGESASSATQPVFCGANWDNVRRASHLYVGQAHSENTIQNINYSTGIVGADNIGSPGNTRTHYIFFENVEPSPTVIGSLGDVGSFNAHSMWLLRVK